LKAEEVDAVNPYRIVLADDHTLLRAGVKKIIEESKDMLVVGEASDGLELLDLLKKETPHLVILDISMPNLRGVEATSEIKQSYPEVEVLILSMHKKKEYLYHSFSAGAKGYVLKDDTDTELLTAIKTIRGGGVYLSSLLANELTYDFIQVCCGEVKPTGETLTLREREILKLVAEGKTSEEVASLLFISARTVQNHRANIMKKLNLKRTAELVKYAISHGYLSETT
jgi:DNA-binding NarL/FixJ family response regulator